MLRSDRGYWSRGTEDWWRQSSRRTGELCKALFHGRASHGLQAKRGSFPLARGRWLLLPGWNIQESMRCKVLRLIDQKTSSQALPLFLS